MKKLLDLTPAELRRHVIISANNRMQYKQGLDHLLANQTSQGGGFLYVLNAQQTSFSETDLRAAMAQKVMAAIEKGTGMSADICPMALSDVLHQLMQSLGSAIEPAGSESSSPGSSVVLVNEPVDEPARGKKRDSPFLIIGRLCDLPEHYFGSFAKRAVTLSALRASNIAVVFLEEGEPAFEPQEYCAMGAHLRCDSNGLV